MARYRRQPALSLLIQVVSKGPFLPFLTALLQLAAELLRHHQ
jgi:hypothetical protein